METFSVILALCAGHWPVNSPHKGKWCESVMFPLICAWINGWVNILETDDLTGHHAHYDFTCTSMSKNLGPVSISNKTFRKASRPRDFYLKLFDRSEIWQAHRQQCCRCVCRIWKRCNDFNYHSRGFDTSRDLTIRRLIGYWNGVAGDLLTR